MMHMKARAKTLVNKIQLGLDANVLSKDEWEGQLSSWSFLKFFRGSLLTVPFSNGRTIRGVKFKMAELDPYSLCLKNQDLYNFNEETFTEDLCKVMESEISFKVRNFINDFMDPEILDLPGWTVAFPWEDYGFFERKKNYLQLLVENRQIYTKSRVVDEHQALLCRPMSVSQAMQYKNLISRIILEGYNSSYRRPAVYILKNNDKWVWVMGGNGNHRAHIMNAFNSAALPVSVIKVIERSQSAKWSNVVNGEYSKVAAEKIFDLVFQGDSRIRGLC